MADVEDLRSASEEEEESEDECASLCGDHFRRPTPSTRRRPRDYEPNSLVDFHTDAYESEASTDPVTDAGDQLDLDVARCCARFGDESAERSTTAGSRTLIVTLKIDPTRSQASAETRQACLLYTSPSPRD